MMSSSHGWNISDNEDTDEESLLPQTVSALKRDRNGEKVKQKFSNPNRIKEKITSVSKSEKPKCPYGNNCYSKNPEHFIENSHSEHPNDNEEKSSKRAKLELRHPMRVWEKSLPHNFMLTTVKGIPNQFNYYNESIPLCSLNIRDILSKEFGDLLETVQFNYCIDFNWFMESLPPDKRTIPILFVHGDSGVDPTDLKACIKKYPNVASCRVDLPPYGTHHTKMMILRYKDGIRVMIHTSNLRESDWAQKTQGMWLSPLFPPEKEKKQKRSLFSFKYDLIDYLNAYEKKSHLGRWVDLIKSHDLSDARVILLGSVPGRHKGADLYKWGHMKLSKALGSHVPLNNPSQWTVIGQFSSIGSLGSDKDKWLCKELIKSLSAVKVQKTGFLNVTTSKLAPFKLIFPSVDDVRTSLEGYPAGGSIPYSKNVSLKQEWLHRYFNRWKATHMGRSLASPHIKSYTRINADSSEAAWFVLTSANLSKAAWGSLEKKDTQLMIRAYELGVLFIPSKVFSDSDRVTFRLTNSESNTTDFALPFSRQTAPYKDTDKPWIWDIPHTSLPDRNGNMWCPS